MFYYRQEEGGCEELMELQISWEKFDEIESLSAFRLLIGGAFWSGASLEVKADGGQSGASNDYKIGFKSFVEMI